MSAFQIFLDALAQLEQDQSLYESDLGGPELQGVQHEEIVKLGGRLLKRLQKFAEMGQSFAETLPPDFTVKLTDTIQTYQDLIVPPKVLGGFCPCLKPARSGPEYEKKMLTAKAKMHASFFVVQAVIIENRGEKINMESMHYADYVNKMNVVSNGLADIKCKGTEKNLENCRKKLLVLLEAVEKFISNFGDSGGKNEFQAEAKRRIRSTQELLTARQDPNDGSAVMPLSRRVLIKAQSSMQEIMNSAAAIALTQAKENLASLETLQTALKKARELEVNTFNSMEEAMNEHGLMEILHRLREDSDVNNSDSGSKLRDAVKRWTTIKAQSVPRKVAEYDEEQDERSRLVSNVLPGDLDPRKAANKVKQDIGNAGNKVGGAVSGVIGNVGGALTGAKDEITTGVKTGVNNIKNIGSKAVKDVNRVLGIENEHTAPTPPPKPAKTGLAKFNPLDMISGGSENDSSSHSKNNSNGNSAQKRTGTGGRGGGAAAKKTSGNAVSNFLDF